MVTGPEGFIEFLEPLLLMHALSLATWWIHITSVLEWIVAIIAVQTLASVRGEPAWRWLALAMVPALVSAMCACTWHLFDNTDELQGLVVLQGMFTMIGNLTLALAALQLFRRQRQREMDHG
jgi:purine-cytosine permease-like protein